MIVLYSLIISSNGEIIILLKSQYSSAFGSILSVANESSLFESIISAEPKFITSISPEGLRIIAKYFGFSFLISLRILGSFMFTEIFLEFY